MVLRQQVEGQLKLIELQHLSHSVALERIPLAQEEITGLLLTIKEEQNSFKKNRKNSPRKRHLGESRKRRWWYHHNHLRGHWRAICWSNFSTIIIIIVIVIVSVIAIAIAIIILVVAVAATTIIIIIMFTFMNDRCHDYLCAY